MIEQFVKVFESPIKFIADGKEITFENGQELAEAEFDKRYSICRIVQEKNCIQMFGLLLLICTVLAASWRRSIEYVTPMTH